MSCINFSLVSTAVLVTYRSKLKKKKIAERYYPSSYGCFISQPVDAGFGQTFVFLVHTVLPYRLQKYDMFLLDFL